MNHRVVVGAIALIVLAMHLRASVVACERRRKYSRFPLQPTTLSWITKLKRRPQNGHCDDDGNVRNAGRGRFHLCCVKAGVA